MEELLQYYEILVLVLVVLILLFIIITYFSVKKIARFFMSQRFKITCIYELEPNSKKERFSISIFNNNVNDSRVVALGLQFRNENIDYFQKYLTQEGLGNESKIVIPSRDSINLKIEKESIKNIIEDLNSDKVFMGRVDVYVIDSLGITTVAEAASIRKNVIKMLKKDRKIEKEKQAKKRAIKRKARREKLKQYWLKIKSKFKKKD